MAVKYVPYFKEPIEGQAILDNFTRTKRAYGCKKRINPISKAS